MRFGVVTKPQDIKVVFDEKTFNDETLKGILRFIPGGAENEDLLRKITKAADGLSPEYRPKEIRITLCLMTVGRSWYV